MNRDSEQTKRENDDLSRKVGDLCTKLHDELITDDEITELNHLLGTSSHARQQYLRCILLNRMLIDSMGKQDRVEAELLGAHVDVNANSGIPKPKSLRVPSKNKPGSGNQRTSVGWAFAVTLAVLLGGALWITNAWNGGPPEVALVDGPDSEDRPSLTNVALVSYVSPTVRWQNANDAPSSGSPVYVGQKLQIDEGAVELTYDSGTKLLLIAPADFVVDDDSGQLVRGGLVASVPEAGHGFTVMTPNGKVVDLGTEFGIAVDDFGVSEVSVFEGKVEAFPITASRNGEEKIELLKGDSLQWKQEGVFELDADLRKFATSVLGYEAKIGTDSFSYVDRFRDEIEKQSWASMGKVRTSDSGLVLESTNSRDDRPYIISADQFNPLVGPVTVTCDFRFENFGEEAHPSFSIMTRADNKRGTAFEPWNGILGSCVCCSFGVISETQESVLQTSIKLGSENLMSSVSWGGFLPPKPNTRYRLVMRDDGVEITFTVSRHDAPSESKTVTCRSLFQNKTNYIALGGMVNGSAIIDRVEIEQEKSTTSLNTYKEFCSLIQSDPIQLAREERLLKELIPDNARLVLEDTFDKSEMDEAKWMKLGDVSQEESRIQLGVPNATGLIDTWKARPYLLTREPLDPSEGSLTIIGRFSFADNFLSGYGATFAVMTRTNDQRGNVGRGWENSILQRGIRTTFWPASADNDHSLEIHEKPEPQTVTLLATQRVDVEPFVRNYIFRVIDDGDSVKLTIIDPLNPEKVMEVASETPASLSRGFVGFESCWGSPIQLDSVRIYQALGKD